MLHVDLILDPPALDVDDDDQVIVEPFRRTSWVLWSKGQILAISGRGYRNRSDALSALETVTGGRVSYVRSGRVRIPTGLRLGKRGTARIDRIR